MRCDYCQGRLDRPGEFGCKNGFHPGADLAQKVVEAVWRFLEGRRGFYISTLPYETQDEIRDALAERVWAVLKENSHDV